MTSRTGTTRPIGRGTTVAESASCAAPIWNTGTGRRVLPVPVPVARTMGGRAHARGAKQTRIQPFLSLENPREAVQTCILLQPPGQATGFRRDANQQCDARDETVCNTLRTGQCVDLHCLFGPPLSDLIQARDHPLCYWSTVPFFFFLRGPRTRASQHALAARTTRLEKKDVHRCHGLLGHKIRAFFFLLSEW